eukprot:8482962-Pyramimonas_sp.AAC.1
MRTVAPQIQEDTESGPIYICGRSHRSIFWSCLHILSIGEHVRSARRPAGSHDPIFEVIAATGCKSSRGALRQLTPSLAGK